MAHVHACARCGQRHRDESTCPALMVGETLAGRFSVVRLVGAGGTASVFKAQNTSIGRFVALKVLHPHLRGNAAAVERFVREGRAMSRVRHEGVVDVLDLVTLDDGAPMLVLEYVRAQTLASEIIRHGAFALPRAMDLIGQLLAVLSAVHERELVHRDLKPANLLVGIGARGKERLKLADFGFAMSLDRAGDRREASRVRMTPPGRVVATPRYLAPELLRGSDGADVRIDVYGAGLVLFEMLTGHAAFESEHLDDLADAILHARPPSAAARVRELPPEIDAIIARALARHPGERFPNAHTMLDALRPFGASADIVDAEPTDTNALTGPNALPAEAYAAAMFRVSSDPPARSPVPRATPRNSDPPRLTVVRNGRAPRLDADPLSTESALADVSRVRGAIIATTLQALREQFGVTAVEDLLDRLPSALRAAVEPPIDHERWYSGAIMTLTVERADAVLGSGDGSLCIAFGRHVARALLPEAHASLFRDATPESALIEAGSLWKHYFEVGALRVPSVGRGYGKLELRDTVASRRSTCLAVAGFVETLVELAGGREVEMVIPTCRAHGDATCTFDVNWMA